MDKNNAGSAAGIDLAKMSRDEVIKIMIKRDMLSQHGYRTLLNGDFISLNLDHLTALANAALARATPQHSVTEQAAAWIDEFGNVWPLGAYSPNGKPSYHDAHKRGWKPLFRAQPQASTAATQPEQASDVRTALQAYVNFASTRRDELGSLSPEMEAVDTRARAALAIPASTAASEQQASTTILAHNVTPQPPGPTVEEMQQALADVEIIAVDDAIARGIPLVDGEQQASVSDATLESALMDVLTQHTELSTDAIDERVPQLVSAIRATIPSEADERKYFEDWSLRNYRHAEVYSQRDYDMGLAAWRAALTRRATTVTPGYKLVPIEPTDDMKDAPEVEVGGCYSCSPTKVSWGECADIYRTMITAAPDIATTATDQQGAAQAQAGDVARLNFMVQHEAWVAFGKDGESCRVFSRNEDGDAVPMLGWGARHWRHDPREAIDAAIAAMAAPATSGGGNG